ncbi:hypothetical protein BDC45DRAFT_540292 [Circinella umbellata]|nr:hypothetical protein BDC45DRAFT_540292 [Circinella umbellata]
MFCNFDQMLSLKHKIVIFKKNVEIRRAFLFGILRPTLLMFLLSTRISITGISPYSLFFFTFLARVIYSVLYCCTSNSMGGEVFSSASQFLYDSNIMIKWKEEEAYRTYRHSSNKLNKKYHRLW